MRKAAYWAVMIVIVLVLVGLSRSDYHIPINAQFALFSNDEGHGLVFLALHGSRIVSQVTGYRAVDGCVVGKARQGFFIAGSGGSVRTFPSREEWARSVKNGFSDFDGRLRAPSRLHDPIWRAMAGGASVILVVWVAIGLCVGRRGRKRSRPAPSQG
jgi:hypothetical protein